MRRVLIAAICLLAVSAGTAGATTVGVSVFGGASIPIAQDDTGTGSQFGLRVPIGLPKLFTIEPYFARAKNGDAVANLGGQDFTRSGFDVNTFGGNLILGSPGKGGMSFFPYVGLNRSKLERVSTTTRTELGFNLGLGLGFTIIPKLWVEGRGEVNMVTTDNTSRKYGNVNIGVGYNFYVGP